MKHNTKMKYVIVGGVAGGATAAARLRRRDEQAEIILIERGDYISYANCGLPYYIGGSIKGRNQLFLQTPQGFSQRFSVDVRTGHEAISIDKQGHSILIRNKEGEETTLTYDKLLISPGARPIVPPLPGIDSKRIFTLRSVPDTDQIKGYITQNKIKHAAVIGAGFIGLEMAESLHQAGIAVSIIEMADQVMVPLDFSMAAMVGHHLSDKGVSVHLKEEVERFDETDQDIRIHLKSGHSISADMVLLSIGVKPESDLAIRSGLVVGARQGIRVNEYLQTSDADIYAVGDAIEYPHPISGEPWHNFLAGPANRQARIAADNIIEGNNKRYEGSIGTGIAKVFDLTAASTGLPAKRLRAAGIPYMSSITHSASHASYYPGAQPLSIKITFAPTDGTLLGAQVVGFAGVDKRIDELALMIKQGGSIYDLTKIEHAYAPPYSSAKDPVAIAGYVAENILSGKMRTCNWREVVNFDPQNTQVIDVRTPQEYALGYIPNALNIPLDELRDRLSEVDKTKRTIIHCAVGQRAWYAFNILAAHGIHDLYNLSGGYRTYAAASSAILPADESEILTPEDNSKERADHRSCLLNTKVDASGIQCPGPIIKLKEAIDNTCTGGLLQITATDPGFGRDVAAYCRMTGHELISIDKEGIHIVARIRKGSHPETYNDTNLCSTDKSGKTFILFSDDLDKAIATFVLANGAAVTGKRVSIFFTFWGINVLKKRDKPSVKKDLFGQMFGWMLPAHSKKLKLSKMNMLGMGPMMIRKLMKSKNVDTLETMIEQARTAGVEFIACQMSMDLMGIAPQELRDDVVVGGVASYMERATASDVNLFI